MTPDTRIAAAKALFGGEPPMVCDELDRESHSAMCSKCARYTRWEMALESVDAVAPLLEGPLQREVEELKAGWAQTRKNYRLSLDTNNETVSGLQRENAELRERLRVAEEWVARLDEPWVDEHGTAWLAPTAHAYAMACKALDTKRADNAALRQERDEARQAIDAFKRMAFFKSATDAEILAHYDTVLRKDVVEVAAQLAAARIELENADTDMKAPELLAVLHAALAALGDGRPG